MTKLASCACGSFLPLASTSCPHCAARVGPVQIGSFFASLPGPVRAAAAVVGGGLLSVTLSACYGSPCAGGSCEPIDSGPDYCADDSMDTDGDGYCLEYDCDETDVAIHELASDPDGDGIDQNCDGVDGILGAVDGG